MWYNDIDKRMSCFAKVNVVLFILTRQRRKSILFKMS